LTGQFLRLQCSLLRKVILMIEQEVIGMEKQAAIDLIKSQGLKVRVRSEDGQAFVGTCDYRLDRINLSIENGKVIKASKG